MKNIKACIFDMDGTLIDSMHFWRKVNFDFLIDHRLTVPPEMMAQLTTMSSKLASKRYAEMFPHLNMTAKDILAEYMDRMLTYYRYDVAPKPGAVAFIQSLRERGIPYCVATTTETHIAGPALDRFGMLEGARFLVCTKDLRLNKSNPACFEAVAARLGYTCAACAVFEDALYAIEGAHKAGCTVCGIEDASSIQDREKILPLCRAFIRDYADLHDFPAENC